MGLGLDYVKPIIELLSCFDLVHLLKHKRVKNESNENRKSLVSWIIMHLQGFLNFDLPEENWQAALDAIKFYDEIKGIIKDGFTSLIESNVEDYNDPVGYQIVLRELADTALLIVHTFKDGANAPYDKVLSEWKVEKEFGSDLDGDFRAKAFLLRK